MKIISEGKIPPPDPPWWTKQTLKCGHCSTVLKLETRDDVIEEGTERRPNGKRWVTAKCPVCSCCIAHTEVAMRGTSPENS
jgi:hypothetical protein